MAFKIAAGIVAVALLITYMVPVVWRLKDIALSTVTTIGIAMMLIDLWQSLRSKDD